MLPMPLFAHPTKLLILLSPLQAPETDQGIKSILIDMIALSKDDFEVCP